MHFLQIDVIGILNVKLYESETIFALVLSMYIKQWVPKSTCWSRINN